MTFSSRVAGADRRWVRVWPGAPGWVPGGEAGEKNDDGTTQASSCHFLVLPRAAPTRYRRFVPTRSRHGREVTYSDLRQ